MPGRRSISGPQPILPGDNQQQGGNSSSTGDTEVPSRPPGTDVVADLRRIHLIRMQERGDIHFPFSLSNQPPEDSQLPVETIMDNRFELETIIARHFKHVVYELAGLSLILFSAKDFYRVNGEQDDAARAQRIEEIENHLRPIRDFLAAREEEYRL